jgi:hypothetical protein
MLLERERDAVPSMWIPSGNNRSARGATAEYVKQSNEDSTGLLNQTQYPSDAIALTAGPAGRWNAVRPTARLTAFVVRKALLSALTSGGRARYARPTALDGPWPRSRSTAPITSLLTGRLESRDPPRDFGDTRLAWIRRHLILTVIASRP